MNGPQVFSVVEVFEVDKGGEDSDRCDQSEKVLSEDAVGFEVSVVLGEEWEDFSFSGETEDGEPG